MKAINFFTENQINKAFEEIAVFIDVMTRKYQNDGYAYIATNEAPESFKELKDSVKNNVVPVANYGCDKSIYSDKETNIKFRFYHDILHLVYNKGFNYQDETFIAEKHIEDGKNYGLSPLALNLLWADTYGQVYYYFNRKTFVDNQKSFVTHCALYGIQNTVKSRKW